MLPQRSSQLVEKPLLGGIRPSYGGGARGGGSPPRVGSNALNALTGKAFSERSEDFSAVERRESNGIFSGCRKSPLDFFDSLRGPLHRRSGPFLRVKAAEPDIGWKNRISSRFSCTFPAGCGMIFSERPPDAA